MACKSNRVPVTALTGHSWQQQSIHTAACGQLYKDYDDINGFVETVETTSLFTGGSVNVTGCGVRLGANSEKGTLQAAAFEAAIANYMAPALPALADACRDEASYTSMKSEMVIYACRYKGFWLTHNMDDLVTDETMLYSSTHYSGMSRPSTCNKDRVRPSTCNKIWALVSLWPARVIGCTCTALLFKVKESTHYILHFSNTTSIKTQAGL